MEKKKIRQSARQCGRAKAARGFIGTQCRTKTKDSVSLLAYRPGGYKKGAAGVLVMGGGRGQRAGARVWPQELLPRGWSGVSGGSNGLHRRCFLATEFVPQPAPWVHREGQSSMVRFPKDVKGLASDQDAGPDRRIYSHSSDWLHGCAPTTAYGRDHGAAEAKGRCRMRQGPLAWRWSRGAMAASRCAWRHVARAGGGMACRTQYTPVPAYFTMLDLASAEGNGALEPACLFASQVTAYHSLDYARAAVAKAASHRRWFLRRWRACTTCAQARCNRFQQC
ncbi:hypothetical protein BDZ91DRAFT_814155 [Kalaharituber pfeilii]|nr:hypothetical protein BDZ91DRAFT_814155 [Kalaharituber pfeilii]